MQKNIFICFIFFYQLLQNDENVSVVHPGTSAAYAGANNECKPSEKYPILTSNTQSEIYINYF